MSTQFNNFLLPADNIEQHVLRLLVSTYLTLFHFRGFHEVKGLLVKESIYNGQFWLDQFPQNFFQEGIPRLEKCVGRYL